MGLRVHVAFIQQLEIVYTLENTICTTLGNKLTLLPIANGKAVSRMPQISQPFLSTKMLILQLQHAYKPVLHFLLAKYLFNKLVILCPANLSKN